MKQDNIVIHIYDVTNNSMHTFQR